MMSANPSLVQDFLSQVPGIAEDRAERLLQRTNNDLARAIAIYHRSTKHDKGNDSRSRSRRGSGVSTPGGRSPAGHTPLANSPSWHKSTESVSGGNAWDQLDEFEEPPRRYQIPLRTPKHPNDGMHAAAYDIPPEQPHTPEQEAYVVVDNQNSIGRKPVPKIEPHVKPSSNSFAYDDPTDHFNPIWLEGKEKEDLVTTSIVITPPPEDLMVQIPEQAKLLGDASVADEIAQPVEEELEDWDFILPELPRTYALLPDSDTADLSFDINTLAAAVQDNNNIHVIRRYLDRFEVISVHEAINDSVEGFPAVFYATATNNEHMLQLFLNYGADPNSRHPASQVPLLAFAILNDHIRQYNSTTVVATLLSGGATSNSIPTAFFTPYQSDLPEAGPKMEQLTDLEEPSKVWCVPKMRLRLSHALSLSQRYYLDKGSRMKSPSVRQIELARRRRAEALLGLPYFLIGQSLASSMLIQNLLLFLAEKPKKPLVLTFAGPSGHGKTELARRLGQLLSLKLEVVDCTIFNHEMELFGPRHPYVNADRGSPLNNFLVDNAGQRCIVFLDEFEKTTSDIHKALLVPFDNGEYQDRRTLNTVDCSNTIWILATNAHDSAIQKFCVDNDATIFADDESKEKSQLAKQLVKTIRGDFLRVFGPPLTGRVSGFVPFLSFAVGEQAVVVHKYIQELARAIREPVNLGDGPEERLVGNVVFKMRRDATVCRTLATSGYHLDLGARSLRAAVDSLRQQIFMAYFEVDEELRVDGEVSEFLIDVDGEDVVVRQINTSN